MDGRQAVILRNGGFATIERVSIADARDTLAFSIKVRAQTTFSSFHPSQPERTIQEEETQLAQFDSPSAGIMLKADIGGALAGIVLCRRERGERVKHAAVLGLNVLQEHWGCGLGRALVEAIIVEAKAIGLSRMELRVREDNLRAISLYESLGFQHEGRLRKAFRVDDQYFDEHIMGLLLD